MAEWDDFGFDDLPVYERDFSDISTEDLERELARRKGPATDLAKSSAKIKGPDIPFPRPATSPRMTMEEAWPGFDVTFHEGSLCPCCGQRVQLYGRKVYGAVAVFLIWLVRTRKEGVEWGSIHDAPMLQGRRGGGDKDKLKFFGLAEEKPNMEDPKKRSSGFWRPTAKGIKFVNRLITIPRIAWGFNSACLGYSEDYVTMDEALGKKFDYREVMGRW